MPVAVFARRLEGEVDPATEARNFAITQQRQAVYDTPSYQAQLAAVGNTNALHALAAQAADPNRHFETDLCWSGMNGCAGHVRLCDWAAKGYGIVRPVLFTARNGAILSGHVWATVAGPARRPGVVITNGSVQADEQMYWYAAQTLAKAGYVVLTFDPQGLGQSDTAGTGADTGEGVPAHGRQCRSRNRRWASRPTTGCRPRRTPARRTRARSPAGRASTPRPARHRRDHHPRWVAPGLLLHPARGVRRLAARPGPEQLVHHRVVRQVRQARPVGRPTVAQPAVA